MAASSPALSNHSPAIAATPSPSPASGANPVNPVNISAALSSTNLSKNLRGLNKPKCIKCGNVARSRCPYQSCKSCCAKAQNPCHIHVLKSATLTDKTQSSSSPLFDQQSTDGSPSGNAHRFSSLRQLSNNFAQFNNLQSPLRSKKPLTRKDAAVINEWRFKKLKEYKEGNIEVENEAFDRYMQNVTLLEEVLAVNPKPEEPTHDGSLDSNPVHNSAGDDTETVVSGLKLKVVSGLKLKLRSNPVRTEKLGKRLEDIVNQGLRKLRKIDLEGSDDPNKQDELVGKLENEKYSALSDLLDKLNKARSEEDLKSCLEMKSQLFNRCRRMDQMETEGIEVSKESAKSDSSPGLRSEYSPPKWLSTATIEQDALNSIDIHFSSLEEVESL